MGVEEPKYTDEDGEKDNGDKKIFEINAACLEGQYFIVCREPPEGDDCGEKKRHRERECKVQRGRVEDELNNVQYPNTPVDDEIGDSSDPTHDKEKGQDTERKEKDIENFPEDIPVKIFI